MAKKEITAQFVSEFFKAAKEGDIQFLEARRSILQGRDTITSRNPQGDTVCHVALQHGHLEFALRVASIYPPLLWASNRLGDTPLHTALKHGRPDIIIADRYSGPFPFQDLLQRYLEDHGRDFYDSQRYVSFVNREGKSLIYLAAEKGYEDVVLHLSTLPAKMEQYYKEKLDEYSKVRAENEEKRERWSVWRNFDVFLDNFLDALGKDYGPNGSTALHVAVREAKSAIVRILLEHRVYLSEQQDGNGHTPLHLAVTMDNPELVEMIVDANAYSTNALNKDGISPFHLAASFDHLEIFKLFLRLYPDCYLGTTNKGQNALHIAVQDKSASIVDYIVNDKKLSEYMINQQDDDGNTPLHVAASKGFDKMQNALLAGSAKVWPLKNMEGLTFDGVAKARKERRSREDSEEWKGWWSSRMIDWSTLQGFWERIRDVFSLSCIQKSPAMVRRREPQRGSKLMSEESPRSMRREKMQSKLVKAMEDFQSSLLVMTTLITTVTFTAAFTLPGGNNDDDPNKGMATLVERAGFDVFLISNIVSMSSSIIATAALILFSVVFSTQQRFSTLKMAIGALGISIIFMLLAVASGVWLVIGSQRRWLAIFIAIVIACTPLLLIFLVSRIIFSSGKENKD